MGPMDQQSITRQVEFERVRPKTELARRLESRGQITRQTKRSRNDVETADEDDPYGTDADEPLPEKPTSMTEVGAYFVPAAFRTHSQNDADFGEADFLQPRESFN